ncbi:sulfate/molybdate ABC transporter ATP-binding protein [Novosphingobium sp. 9]|uniref:sulfate/molybdate ABC transporter ATP-binding protein n=1 Tax=Novosphingobium sp. 9 TaxID=2025349 RepID=UPI0021B6962E|nr:sulfate/molybdate ABC transporter ATP-binding protein [Novosphingobium sp. 9]
MIRLENISKSFGTFAALNDVSLTVNDGEFLALLGPSGSGKTTLLRIIAGLEFAESGRVLFEDEDVTHRKVADRKVGFVFQNYALFQHMSVRDNVGFGLSVRKRSERPKARAIRERAQELLELVQLGHLGDRVPAQLSGGQRQRVALARALAVEPRLLLLDEPFGALDAKVRKDLRRWLRSLHEQMGLTSIFVTHDQEEALELADRIVVMDHGVIEQVGAPEDIYTAPGSAFVSDFVGETNRIGVSVQGGQAFFAGQAIRVPLDGLVEGPADLHFRPHDARLCETGSPGSLPLLVHQTYRKGGHWRVEGRIEGLDRPIEVDVPAEAPAPAAGLRIGVQLARAMVFPSKEGSAHAG